MHCVGSGDGRTEALDGREDLFVQIPFYVWLQGRGGGHDLLRGKGAFGRWFGGRDGGGGSGGHYVGDYVVDADRFALREGTEGDLDLRHGVGVGVVFGVFTQFLSAQLGWFRAKGGKEDLR